MCEDAFEAIKIAHLICARIMQIFVDKFEFCFNSITWILTLPTGSSGAP